MILPPTIYQYIKTEESKFDTDEIQVGNNWRWNFKNHVQLIFHLKNGVFFTGENNWMRAFKNVMEDMLNLAYWTEDIEVKDVVFFIENSTGRALSFLIKKYHDEVYVREHNLDTLFDQITESDLDYGGVLVQKTNGARPERLNLTKIAFCDQTDILGGPIGFKFNFSPAKLRSMSKLGWGNKSNGATISIEELIMLASQEKDPAGLIGQKENLVTGKSIEVYVVKGGELPENYLKEDGDMEKFVSQVQVVAFYTDKNNQKEGVTLYRREGDDESLKFHTSKEVEDRALGRGVGEALLHPQIWTNFLTIHKTKMLESASKIPLYTDDPELTSRSLVQDMDNLELANIADGKRIYQVPTAAPANIQLFEASINEWYQHAQNMASAQDPILGKEAASGTTFRGQERSVAQGRGIHDRRRGQRAKFIEEIYRDWIIPDMVKEITKGKEFLASLTSDEMMWVSDQMADNYAHKKQIEDLFAMRIPQDKEIYKQEFREQFKKRGDRHLIKILKEEMRGVEVKMGINIAGKQKDLVGLSDKILSVFQFALTNPVPQHLQKSFNDLLEYGGLSPVDFSAILNAPVAQPLPPQGQPTPLTLNQPQQV